MMKTKYLSIIILIGAAIQTETYSQESNFRILVLEKTPVFMDSDSLTATSLNEDEISSLRNLAQKCIQKWDKELPMKHVGVNENNRKLDDYYRQYLPANNKSGDKLVWINFIKKSKIKELPQELYVSAHDPHCYNCWVNLNQLTILD